MKNSKAPQAFQAKRESLEFAAKLLSPALDLLRASGLTERQAQTVFERTWNGVGRKKNNVKVNFWKRTDTYGDVVSAWVTNHEYLDLDGSPLVLPIRGRRSFTSLLRGIDKTLPVPEAIDELRRFGNVRRMPKSRVKLLKKFLHVASNSSMAFEPHYEFLANASETVGSLLANRPSSRGNAKNFWRAVEELEMPASKLAPFLAFIDSRSLSFLEEVDEWLRANSRTSVGKAPRVKAGLGLFTYGRGIS